MVESLRVIHANLVKRKFESDKTSTEFVFRNSLYSCSLYVTIPQASRTGLLPERKMSTPVVDPSARFVTTSPNHKNLKITTTSLDVRALEKMAIERTSTSESTSKLNVPSESKSPEKKIAIDI